MTKCQDVNACDVHVTTCNNRRGKSEGCENVTLQDHHKPAFCHGLFCVSQCKCVAYRGQKNRRKLFCTEFFENPSGHVGSPQTGRLLNGALGPRRKINLGMPCASSKALNASWVDHRMGTPFFKPSNAEEKPLFVLYVSVVVRQHELK